MPLLELAGQQHPLPTGSTVVGSGAAATWRIPSQDLAARHFTILRTEGTPPLLRPCSPHAVVTVNGRQVALQGVPLAEGDIIAAGAARFRYVRDETALAAAPPLAEATEPAFLVQSSLRRAFPLSRRVTGIGRDATSPIWLRDPVVSRFHADVRAEAGSFVLYSMGSAGSFVNGERVGAPRVLDEGDRVAIGSAEFVFTRRPLPDGVAPVDTAPPSPDEESGRHPTPTLPVHRVRTVPGPWPSIVRLLASLVVVALVLGWLLLR